MPDAPLGRDDLNAEKFLSEAAQLHQTWIRRFDVQHKRRPRPPDIEAERLRLVRRLQLVQRLQLEMPSAEEFTVRLEYLRANIEEARLVDGDDVFLEALQATWGTAQMPQASTLAAGANPPKASSIIEFRW